MVWILYGFSTMYIMKDWYKYKSFLVVNFLFRRICRHTIWQWHDIRQVMGICLHNPESFLSQTLLWKSNNYHTWGFRWFSYVRLTKKAGLSITSWWLYFQVCIQLSCVRLWYTIHIAIWDQFVKFCKLCPSPVIGTYFWINLVWIENVFFVSE